MASALVNMNMDGKWLLTVDMLKKPSGNRNYGLVLSTLGLGKDRYDLRLENGDIIARGIFDNGVDLGLLANLIKTISGWNELKVHFNAQPLSSGSMRQLALVWHCASERRHCLTDQPDEETAYWGCHLAGIRLVGFDLKTLLYGEKYWFSFFVRSTENPDYFTLDKLQMQQAQRLAMACPHYPMGQEEILKKLPDSVYLAIRAQSRIWKLTPSKLKIGVPIIPRNSEQYHRWLMGKLT
jgi:hypothetical protein